MPDPFRNARPYYDVTFPSSGESFSLPNFRNAFQGIASLDLLPLRPMAQNPPSMKVSVRGRDSDAFYNPVYYGDADKRIFFSSGDTTSMTAPTNNPRIDLVYLTPSGDLRIITGTEAATPSLPGLSPSGDSRIPICAVYHRVGSFRIVNFEDKDSNTGDSYIYQDLRPFLRQPASAGGGVAAADNLTWTGQHDFTGAEILGGSPFRFEGSGDNNLYHTLTFVGPTAARTATFGNESYDLLHQVVKGWAVMDNVNERLLDSFNVTSYTKLTSPADIGRMSVTWDENPMGINYQFFISVNNFAGGNSGFGCSGNNNEVSIVGATDFQTRDHAGTLTNYHRVYIMLLGPRY